jgi:hypothetical protein
MRMKTTLNIQDQLLANAKSLAALQQTTLTRLIEEGLAMRLAVPAKKPAFAARNCAASHERQGRNATWN